MSKYTELNNILNNIDYSLINADNVDIEIIKDGCSIKQRQNAYKGNLECTEKVGHQCWTFIFDNLNYVIKILYGEFCTEDMKNFIVEFYNGLKGSPYQSIFVPMCFLQKREGKYVFLQDKCKCVYDGRVDAISAFENYYDKETLEYIYAIDVTLLHGDSFCSTNCGEVNGQPVIIDIT